MYIHSPSSASAYTYGSVPAGKSPSSVSCGSAGCACGPMGVGTGVGVGMLPPVSLTNLVIT